MDSIHFKTVYINYDKDLFESGASNHCHVLLLLHLLVTMNAHASDSKVRVHHIHLIQISVNSKLYGCV